MMLFIFSFNTCTDTDFVSSFMVLYKTYPGVVNIKESIEPHHEKNMSFGPGSTTTEDG